VSSVPATNPSAADPTPLSRRLVAARFIALIKLLHRSAGPAYRSETRLSDFEWRVMTQVGDQGPLVLTALAALLNQDKGQVSHAVKVLVQGKLVSREHLRAPIVLTRNGRAMFERIVRLGRARNAVLGRDLSEAERRVLPQLLAKLQANARSLLSQAQATRLSDSEADDVRRAPRPAEEVAPARASPRKLTGGDSRLIAQDLFMVHNLLQRSAAITFRQATGLSDFEWRVLVQVGERAPLTLIQLVPLLSRDKSQVGRTLTRLDERGLITREKIGGGRHVLVGISERGREVYAQLTELALERNTALIAGLSSRDQQMLTSILDKLEAGAAALLAKRAPA
jgi:DNA-binding MarR family transcriptional regulator